MKNINEISVVRGGQIQTAAPTQPTSELNDFARQNINNVFARLKAIFPAWRSAYPDDAALAEAKKIWVLGFIDAGIGSTEQVAAGMRKARLSGMDFFPSVGKFIAWCKPQPEDIGLPPASSAYQEAAYHAGHPSRRVWSHPAVYAAGGRCGWFDLRNGDISEARFKTIYADVCAEALAGAQFEQPRTDSTRLEHHNSGKAVVTEEAKAAGREALADLKRAVGLPIEDLPGDDREGSA
jgi:hypothetical protein